MKVLVIEDNPADMELLKDVMSDHWASPLEFVHEKTLAAGISRLAGGEFDCILLDLGLPDSQGIETVRAVRQAQSEIPIVVLTGLDDAVSGVQALQEGAQDYLVKSHMNGFSLARSIQYAHERNRIEAELIRKNRELMAAEEKLQEQNEELQAIEEELRRNNEELLGTEQILRERTQYLENLITYANAPIVVLNPKFQITRFNRAFEILTGRTADSMVGREIEPLFPEDQREEIMLSMIRQLRGGKPWKTMEIPILHKQGAIRNVIWNSAVIYDTDGKSVLSIIAQGQDITDQIRATKALQESEARFRSVLDNSHDVIYRLNVQTGQYEYISPAAQAVVGFSPDELTAMNPETALSMIHPDDLPLFRARVAELDVVGNVDLEYRQQTKNGDYRWISNHMSLIRDNNGRPLYRIGNIRDITTSKQIDEELRSYAMRLKRSNEDLERFAFIASHDLQEPLRNVVSFSQLLSKRYTGRMDTDADEFIGYIVEGGKRMQDLVQDLLEYSRVNMRGIPFMTTDCEELLDRVMQNLFLSIQESSTTIETTSLPTVLADPRQLAIVFQNLISNAIKFRSTNPPLIHISADKIDDMWKFAVKDNGIGIDPAFNDRIFEIFQRLHTRDKYPGTGVGLAIVKKIIERHGGQIWVESEVGEGSTFYFTLSAVPNHMGGEIDGAERNHPD
jgi:PAS domain S-box-containing protein